MPRGLRRYQASGQTHFITFSCYHRLRNLDDPARRDLVVRCLEHTRKKFQFLVYGFVVMPEHVHLLVSEPLRRNLAIAMQSMKLSVSLQAPRTREATAGAAKPLWLPRYYDHNVRNYDSFVDKLRYIHRNPVKRGLVGKPEEWKWSSFRHYATAEDCGVQIESEWTARRREREVRVLTCPKKSNAD
jgi:putative transposase